MIIKQYFKICVLQLKQCKFIRKFGGFNAYSSKEQSKRNNLHFQVKELGKKKHNKPKISESKEINIRWEINEIENRKQKSPKFSSLKALTELTNLSLY